MSEIQTTRVSVGTGKTGYLEKRQLLNFLIKRLLFVFRHNSIYQ